MGTARSRAAKIAALVLYIIVILVATPQAQQPVQRGRRQIGPPHRTHRAVHVRRT